jgi:3-isopropylmalate/(R)-2-methylmalate dehydratase small subunit
MKPFSTVCGPAVVLLQPNIDTDVIIRIERLMNVAREDLGKYAFEALRFHKNGDPVDDCVFNLPQYRNAPVLIAGENFGCGSSREGAVWALESMGFQCVIAESFGDIFYNNCLQNGILPVRLTRQEIADLVDDVNTGQQVTADLHAQTISASQACSYGFEIDQLKRDALLSGLDDIESSLRLGAEIAAWQRADRLMRPWVWLVE